MQILESRPIPESIFRAARRTVPAARVMIDEENGGITAALRLRELDDLQVYDPALL
jgi:hypothetical protein